MSRTLSAEALEALLAQQTGEVFLVLLKISHDDMVETIRVVNNTEDVVAVDNTPENPDRAGTYIGCPFTINIPNSTPNQLPRARISIDRVDPAIVVAIRSISDSPSITMEVVLASDPDTIEVGPYTFVLHNVSYNKLVVSGDLEFEDLLSSRFPKDVFTPQLFPGAFA